MELSAPFQTKSNKSNKLTSLSSLTLKPCGHRHWLVYEGLKQRPNSCTFFRKGISLPFDWLKCTSFESMMLSKTNYEVVGGDVELCCQCVGSD